MSNQDDIPSRLELLVRIVELERELRNIRSELNRLNNDLEAVLKTKQNFYYNHSFLQVSSSSESEDDPICL